MGRDLLTIQLICFFLAIWFTGISFAGEDTDHPPATAPTGSVTTTLLSPDMTTDANSLALRKKNILESDWKKSSHNSDGITVYTKSIKGTSLTGFKGICTINSPIETVYAILSNVDDHTRWVKYCSEAKTIKSLSPNNAIQYYNFDIPWPFVNRDIIVRSVTDINKDTGIITVNSSAFETQDVPLRKSHLRITDSRHKWILKKISSDKTEVTFISLTSLKGSVPVFLNKLISRVIPSSSLKNLKNIATRQHYAALPQFIAKSESDDSAGSDLF